MLTAQTKKKLVLSYLQKNLAACKKRDTSCNRQQFWKLPDFHQNETKKYSIGILFEFDLTKLKGRSPSPFTSFACKCLQTP